MYTVVIPNFEETIKITEKRRTEYYRHGSSKAKKLPKKYFNKDKYAYKPFKNTLGKINHYLVDISTNEKVISNPIAKDKPRTWKINGQALYSGNLNHRQRSVIAIKVHEYLYDYIKDLPVITTAPGEMLTVRAIIYDIYPQNIATVWDCSNKWPWIKWFEDTLVEHGKIEDDSIDFVRSSGTISFVEITDLKERKLCFVIEKVNYESYCKQLNNLINKYPKFTSL